MISEQQKKNLDPLASVLLRQFEQQFKEMDSEIDVNDDLEIFLPARNTELGGLRILSEGNEVTVHVGNHYHQHFETDLGDNPNTPESREEAVSDAMDFVREIVEDQVVLEVVYEDDKPVNAGIRYADDDESWSRVAYFRDEKTALRPISPKKIRVEKHLWSGPAAS